MTRSQLKNKAIDRIDIAKFKRQGNLVVSLYKQAKLKYFEKLSVDCNSKSFWKAYKSYFSSRSCNI